MDDELLDLVDKNDQVIGTINRADYPRLLKEDLGYIRAVNLFIVNSQGKIWVPVRTAHKTIAPNGYDFSAAGHVASGADYVQTLIRETKEEINLDITKDDVELVGKVRSDDIKYFLHLYLLRTDKTPTFNPDDFVRAEWLTPDELIQNIDNGHPGKSSLLAAVEALRVYLKG